VGLLDLANEAGSLKVRIIPQIDSRKLGLGVDTEYFIEQMEGNCGFSEGYHVTTFTAWRASKGGGCVE